MKKILLIFCLLLASCTQSYFKLPERGDDSQIIPCPRQWNNCDKNYQVLHAGLLSFKGKELPLQGLMEFSPTRKTARLTIWSIFGVKMLSLSILAGQTKAVYIQSALAKIPGFTDLASKCVQYCFFSQDKTCYYGPQNVIFASGESEGEILSQTYDLSGLLQAKNSRNWKICYSDYFRFKDVNIPKMIVYTHKKFKISLKLKEIKAI